MGNGKNSRWRAWFPVLLLCGVLCHGAVGGAEGVPGLDDDAGLSSLEYDVFGREASNTWRQSDFGGGEFARGDEKGRSFSNMGGRLKAGLLSAILPGAGQYYNGDHSKALIFGAVEAALWTSWYVFDTQGDNRTDTFVEYAMIHAGTEGEHNDSYWQSVASYMHDGLYNEKRRRNARAEGVEPTMLVSPEDGWQWQTDDDLRTFQSLRADAIIAYDRRDFTVLFFIVNRAISIFDAVRSSGDGTLPDAEVLGFKINVDVTQSFQNPGAKCTFSHSF